MASCESYDWTADDRMAADETMRRFEDLEPVPTTGPEPRMRPVVNRKG